MELSYLILAHKNPDQMIRLINKLNDKNTNFYVHIDRDTSITPFKKPLASLNNIKFIKDEDRVISIWGDISLVKATIKLLNMVLADNKKGYCVLLSGQDYPLKNNEYIQDFFAKANGLNFITSEAIPRKTWSDGGISRIKCYNFHSKKKPPSNIEIPYIFSRDFYKKKTIKQIAKLLLSKERFEIGVILKKRNVPKNIKPHGGSQWWALPMDTIKIIMSFLDSNPNYLKYHKYTQVPDEIFFHSIISSVIPKNLIHNKLTYDKWPKANMLSPVTFTTENLDELLSLEYLFARKFDINLDENILDEIDKTH